ncbi:MAG: glycosyltransferase family 2 protein [Solirubrobacteraceae bacterium]
MSNAVRYSVISPVRDEAEHFARTAEALIAQSQPPAEWIVVDDGSTDGTYELAAGYAAAHPWIQVVRSDADHERARGAPIVRAFKRGMRELREPYDVVVKLDGDIYLAPQYFAWVCDVFARDERAGIVGGVSFIPGPDGRWRLDNVNLDSLRGIAKAYRATCLEDIGGLPESMGWDGIDEFAARARDWNVHVLTELPILHYRPRGARQRWWKSRWEEGRANHFMGYRWSFLAVRAAKQALVQYPPLLGGLLLAAGFVSAAITRRPRHPDDAAIALLREDQRRRLGLLAGGRTTTTARPLPGGGPAYTATGRPAGD